MAQRNRTSTSSFGVSRRETHDASGFYRRFEPPVLSGDATVVPPRPLDAPFICADARTMRELDDCSVALVVTSPPYFAGKQYEEELDRAGVPSSYLEYLGLLRDVFAECVRALEPGGRIAVNVANLGRKPYRSLSADVIGILQDDLKLLLRGEVIWRKGEGASGSCAWGSFRSPANPVLRDLTERVVVASKGRFDRARSGRERAALGLPKESTLTTDEFLAATLDVWEIPAESAIRVGHPAPFPVELPERLVHLYTYRDDLVLDPFMGSGSTLVAAARAGRRYVGYDIDPTYCEIARARVASALTPPPAHQEADGQALALGHEHHGVPAAAERTGKAAQAIAAQVVEEAGFTVVGREVRLRGTGLSVPLVVHDRHGLPWYVEVSGAFTTTRGGLLRVEAVWRALGRASVLAADGKRPLLLLTSHLPARGSAADVALRAAGTAAFFDAIEMLSAPGRERLGAYAAGGHHHRPLPGFWASGDLDSDG